jgi:hypothetical protein
MRVERVGLEHHRKATFRGRHVGGVVAVDLDMPAGDVLQPRDQAQKRGFPAARGPDKDGELAILDGQVQRWNDLNIAKALGHVVQLDTSHWSVSFI